MGWSWGDVFEAASTLLGAKQKYDQGKEQQRALDDQARADEVNANLDKERANDALKRGVMEADRAAQRKRSLVGKQRAAMGVSGVAVGRGSFSNVINDTLAAGAEDEDTIMQNSIREAWGYTARSNQSSASAGSNRRAGRKSSEYGTLGALGTLAAGTYSFGKNRWW